MPLLAEQMTKQANQYPRSVLLLTMSDSVSDIVKKFEGKKAKDRTGDWHAVWEALNEKYNNHTNQTRRAC